MRGVNAVPLRESAVPRDRFTSGRIPPSLPGERRGLLVEAKLSLIQPPSAALSPGPDSDQTSTAAAMVTPPHDREIVALSLPPFMAAGAVSGTAIAPARSEADLSYLIDNADVAGPPVWVQEGEVDKCMLEPMLVRCE